MGKFLAGVVVGVFAFEVAMYYGYGKKTAIPNGLPSDNPVKTTDCNCQTVLPTNSTIKGTNLNRRSISIA